MRKETALCTEISVILHLLTDAAKIINTKFWEVGNIFNLDRSGKLLVCSEVSSIIMGEVRQTRESS